MPAKRLPWFKLWPESFEHEKIATLEDGVWRTWVTLIGKASCQPVRWRFASVKHAAAACGRPEAEVQAVLDARLLDQLEDGLWVHDWEQWQERYPSDYPNTPRTLPEDSANAPSTLPDYSLEMRDERSEMGDVPVEDELPEGIISLQGSSTKGVVRGKRSAKAPQTLPHLSDDQQERANTFSVPLARYGFDPPPQFWPKVLDKYGRLDLEEESLKIAGWLKQHSKRQCSPAFVLNWLAKAWDSAPLNVRSAPVWDEPPPAQYDDTTPIPERLQPACTACAWGRGEHAAYCGVVRAETA